MNEYTSPIATLQFNLPEHREDLMDALNGVKYKIALDDMDNYLRGKLKYEDLPDAVNEALQAARDHLTMLTSDFPE